MFLLGLCDCVQLLVLFVLVVCDSVYLFIVCGACVWVCELLCASCCACGLFRVVLCLLFLCLCSVVFMLMLGWCRVSVCVV